MSLFEEGQIHHFRTTARQVFDVTGAGDTVIACLAMATTGGAQMNEAAVVANHAAGLVVGKIGTASINSQELINSFKDSDAYPSD